MASNHASPPTFCNTHFGVPTCRVMAAQRIKYQGESAAASTYGTTLTN